MTIQPQSRKPQRRAAAGRRRLAFECLDARNVLSVSMAAPIFSVEAMSAPAPLERGPELVAFDAIAIDQGFVARAGGPVVGGAQHFDTGIAAGTIHRAWDAFPTSTTWQTAPVLYTSTFPVLMPQIVLVLPRFDLPHTSWQLSPREPGSAPPQRDEIAIFVPPSLGGHEPTKPIASGIVEAIQSLDVSDVVSDLRGWLADRMAPAAISSALAYSTDGARQEATASADAARVDAAPALERWHRHDDAEGGLIELETGDAPGLDLGPSDDSDEPIAKRKRRHESSTLDGLWAELGKLWDAVEEAQQHAREFADAERADQRDLPVDAGATTPDESLALGLIELPAAVGAAEPLLQAAPPALVDDGLPRPDLDAGVAVFQAFELAAPGDTSGASAAAATEQAAEALPSDAEHAQADDAEAAPSHTSRALTGAGLLVALPFSWRALRERRRNQQQQPTV